MASSKVPQLNGVRAFEAAARQLSFSNAAQELNVTPSAVSHQIRTLEARLGVPLFLRLNRSTLVLTDAGSELFASVQRSLFDLSAAFDRIADVGARGNRLAISVSPYFASKWLLPRIASFRARHPEIELRICSNQYFEDFSTGAIDVAIRYGDGEWGNLNATRFLSESMFPICSRSYMDGFPDISIAEKLRNCVILDDERCNYWSRWCKRAEIGLNDGEIGPRRVLFNDVGLVMRAAISGNGIGMGRSILINEEINRGELICISDVSIDGGYYLVGPPATCCLSRVSKLRNWLLETGESGASLG